MDSFEAKKVEKLMLGHLQEYAECTKSQISRIRNQNRNNYFRTFISSPDRFCMAKPLETRNLMQMYL
jgi:hypothetical protein